MRHHEKTNQSNQAGFSIVEMIVAMVVFMIIVGTIYGLLQIGLIDRNRASRRSDVLKNARAAMHLIGRDALNAGLSYNKSGAVVPDGFISARLGITTYADGERDVLTSIVGGNDLFYDILNTDPNSRTDLISFSYRDSDFNGGNVISLNNATTVGGAPTTVRLQTAPNDARNAKGYDLYLVESDSSQVAVMATGLPSQSAIDIAPGDPLAINQPLGGSGITGSLLQKCTAVITENCTTYVASVKRFFWVAYRVKADGTLVRIVFGNNTGAGPAQQIQELPVAYNIEDFQVRYILEDGSATDDPAAGPDAVAGTADDTPQNFNLVRQITVTIRVQATESDEQLGRPESITLIGTFSTRNLEYDAG
ncbi:MAG: prepilin-type N-terminal cleavage/methylation domain-containing protein [Acidobacteria bacterium]|nr:prepilin-type N-terminal cleavage/methylation domain-containing protein [Acidobacteriota bacterium]